jgi:WD40 repeat protein
MFSWLFVNFLGGNDNPPLPIQRTALAFLSSVVADGNILTDWLYYNYNVNRKSDVSKELLILQFVSCMFGTISWIGVMTDGRLMNWLMSAVFYILWLLVAIPWLLLLIMHIMLNSIGIALSDCVIFAIEDSKDWINDNILEPLWGKAAFRKPIFSSGAVLLFGILAEDIPQLFVTVLIEFKIKPKGDEISCAALINILFAIFDIMHKVAHAYDVQRYVQKAAYEVKWNVKAHGGRVYSLVSLSGSNQIISTSRDNSAKVWDTVTAKCVRVLMCESYVWDTVAMGTSKVITACQDKRIRIFDCATWVLDYTLELQFSPRFVCLSPDLGSFFTGCQSFLQRWDMQTECDPQLLTTFKGGATALTFLDNDTFVSCDKYSSNVHVWDKNEVEPILTLVHGTSYVLSVAAMSSNMFLIGDWKGRIKSFELVNNEWSFSKTFKEHTYYITSLTKINGNLFVSTSRDTTAKLWDITKVEASSLLTFPGHTAKVCSSVYLKEEQAVATGDKFGIIKVWSIAKYLKHDKKQSAASQKKFLHANNSDEDHSNERINPERESVELIDQTSNTDVDVQLENV